MPAARTTALRRAVGAVIAVLAAVALLSACASSQAGRGVAAPAADVTSPVAPPTPVTITPKPVDTPAAEIAVNHCAGNTKSQLVKVSLREQHMWLCSAGKTVLDTAITSGASSLPYDSTPTGNFHIQGRNTNSVLTLNTGAQYHVKYWIPFSAPLYGFHDSSWQKFTYGSPQYKTDGSHGCVHMPLKAIEYLYHWVHMGTSVQIRA